VKTKEYHKKPSFGTSRPRTDYRSHPNVSQINVTLSYLVQYLLSDGTSSVFGHSIHSLSEFNIFRYVSDISSFVLVLWDGEVILPCGMYATGWIFRHSNCKTYVFPWICHNFWLNLYCLDLILCLQGQVLQYLALWHLCLCFILWDMWVDVRVVYLSCVTDAQYHVQW
jgi:hypothetical protein